MAINSQSSRNVHGGPGGLPLEIPLDTKKIVQNLREVVGKNCADSEIYAILVDCNMDANDAVQRLLSQGHFSFSSIFHVAAVIFGDQRVFNIYELKDYGLKNIYFKRFLPHFAWLP